MPLTTIKVARVETLPRVGGQRFLVYPERSVNQRGWTPSYETLDAWKASACDAARLTGEPVKVLWVENTHGRQIISVTAVEVRNADGL